MQAEDSGTVDLVARDARAPRSSEAAGRCIFVVLIEDIDLAADVGREIGRTDFSSVDVKGHDLNSVMTAQQLLAGERPPRFGNADQDRAWRLRPCKRARGLLTDRRSDHWSPGPAGICGSPVISRHCLSSAILAVSPSGCARGHRLAGSCRVAHDMRTRCALHAVGMEMRHNRRTAVQAHEADAPGRPLAEVEHRWARAQSSREEARPPSARDKCRPADRQGGQASRGGYAHAPQASQRCSSKRPSRRRA